MLRLHGVIPNVFCSSLRSDYTNLYILFLLVVTYSIFKQLSDFYWKVLRSLYNDELRKFQLSTTFSILNEK